MDRGRERRERERTVTGDRRGIEMQTVSERRIRRRITAGPYEGKRQREEEKREKNSARRSAHERNRDWKMDMGQKEEQEQREEQGRREEKGQNEELCPKEEQRQKDRNGIGMV
jgi:hypothetical protein